MDCTLIEGDLIPFHFGTLAEAPRAALESHLRGCASCLVAYLEVKRALDQGAASVERPSQLLKARLRTDLAAEFVRGRRLRRVVGAVAAMLVVGTLLGVFWRRPTRAPAPLPAVNVTNQPIDSARPVTASVRFL